MKKSKLNSLICTAAVLLGVIVALNCGASVIKTHTGTSDAILFLDPGHGGMDGGAVSSDGIPEKDINLAIALRVREMAEEYGWHVIMTREADESLGDEGKGSIRSKKTADLKARRDMLKKYEPKAAVSIHLNSFKEDPSVKGVQVFYPESFSDRELQKQCEEFAKVMQRNLSDATEADRERVPLVKEDVFLFKEEVCPIVIVECGFLSNREEAKLLRSEKYQRILAQGILDGITEFTGVERKKDIEVIDSLSGKNKS